MSHKPQRLRYDTERLKDGPITHELDVHPEVLDLLNDPEYTFDEAVTGRLTATLVGTTVLLTGTVKTTAKAPCARCLTDLRVPLKAQVTLVYMQDERLLDPVRYPELYEDNTFWYDGEAVYPAEQLREMLLLQLPTVTACELEADDICPVRNVRIEPMVFGPQRQEAASDEPPNDNSLAGQLARLRKEMGK